MKAIIHEWIKPDDHELEMGKVYEVPDLSEELERIDSSGAIYLLSSAIPNHEKQCIEAFIIYFI